MAAGQSLRTLLIDCRIALRRVPPSDELGALGARIDAAIRELDRKPAAHAVEDLTQGRLGSHQVALAWQTACRGLMLEHPHIYSELRDKVMELLDLRELRDPDQELLAAEAEIKRLHEELGSLRTRLNEVVLRLGQAQGSLDALREALREAAADLPDADRHRDPQALALACIDWLRQRSPEPEHAAEPVAEEGPAPSEKVLRAVAAGQREFTPVQREWVIGEALGITGWSMTPLELLEKGDVWLARTILERVPAD